MPQITQLKPQKNNKRVNVYVDGKYAFGIDLDNLYKYGIQVEKEFSSKDLNKIIFEAEFHKAFEKLLRFSMARPRSEKEISDWFKRKKIPESFFKNLKLKIKNLGLLDDQKFAKWWVEQRLHFRKKGKRVLQMELRQKGVDREIIEKVLQNTPIDERKMAQELLTKKAYKWEKFDEALRRRKQSEFLLRNGFGWEVVRSLTGKGSEE